MSIKKTLAVVALSGLAAAILPGCQSATAGRPYADIGSKNDLAEGGGVGNIGVAVAENLVWIPWKLVTGPIVGAVQGGIGWYELTGEPVSGTLTLPLGVGLGIAEGAVNGLGQEPIFVERDDNLFRVLGNPFRTDHEMYHYTTPPHAQPRYAGPTVKYVSETPRDDD